MKKIKCKYCNYEWESKSEMLLVTCPNCGKKTERKKDER